MTTEQEQSTEQEVPEAPTEPSATPSLAPTAGADRAPDTHAQPAAPAGWLETMYGVLFAPVGTFRAFVRRPNLLMGFVVLMVVNLVSTLTTGSIAARELFNGTRFAGASGSLFVVATTFGALFAWFLGTAVYHLSAELFGGEGRARTLLGLEGLTALPIIFQAPVVLLARLTGIGFDTPITLGLGLWSLVLTILGVRENYRFSTGRAVAVVLIPPLVLGILFVSIIIIAVAAAALMMPFFQEFGPGLPQF